MNIMTRHVPDDWRLEKLGQLFEERKEKVSDKEYSPLSVAKQGIVPQMEHVAKSDDSGNRKRVAAGDFLINGRSDRRGSSGLSELDGSVSLINMVLKPRHGYPRFIHHLMRSYAFQEEFYRFGRGIVADLWTTRYSELKGITVAIPDEQTQKEIADFLDREIAHIDLLIEKKEKLLSLLTERFISLKNQVLTKGIHKDISFVDTSQEFFPAIPAHWSIEKLKYSLLKIEQGWSPQAENRAIKDGQWGVLKIGCVNNGFYDCSQHKALPLGVEPQKKLEVREGDILMSRGNSLNLVGSVGLVKETLPNLMISDLLYRLYFDKRKISADFATYVLSSHYIRKQIELSASGSSDTMPKISQNKIKSFLWILPNIEEQKQIVSYLDNSLQLINDASKKCEYSCDLLKQLKASLITEAVTGQLDIKIWKKRGSTDKRLDNIEEAMRS